MSKIIGVEYELRNGRVLAKETGTAVVVANHQSFFDVLGKFIIESGKIQNLHLSRRKLYYNNMLFFYAGMFTIWHLMEKCTAIARKKVFWIWPFGLLAWLAGVVFIDRVPSNEKTYKTVNKAAEYVCSQRVSISGAENFEIQFGEEKNNSKFRSIYSSFHYFCIICRRNCGCFRKVRGTRIRKNYCPLKKGHSELPFPVNFQSFLLFILRIILSTQKHIISEKVCIHRFYSFNSQKLKICINRYLIIFLFIIGKVIMEALEPIPTKGLTLNDIDTLIEKVYNLMSAKNDEFRRMLKMEQQHGKLPCCKNL